MSKKLPTIGLILFICVPALFLYGFYGSSDPHDVAKALKVTIPQGAEELRGSAKGFQGGFYSLEFTIPESGLPGVVKELDARDFEPTPETPSPKRWELER